MREAAFDELYGAFECNAGWSQKEMDVIGHDDEGVKEISAFAPIVLKCIEEQFSIVFDAENSSALGYD
jgi:hypothetical protein